MNQEYVVLGGLFWKFLGKKIFFWRRKEGKQAMYLIFGLGNPGSKFEKAKNEIETLV